MPYKDKEKRKAYHKIKSHDFYIKNKEKISEKNKKWTTEHPIAYNEIRKRSRIKHREDLTAYSQQYRANNPIKYKAHLIMKNAIRNHEIIPQPCEICGNEKTQGHHDDYNKPLEIRWLCSLHHNEIHHGHKYRNKPVNTITSVSQPMN